MTDASTTRSAGVRSGNPDNGVTRDMPPIVPSRGPRENVRAHGKYRATLPLHDAGDHTVVAKVTAGLSIVGGIAQAGTTTGDSEWWPAVSVIINEVTIK